MTIEFDFGERESSVEEKVWKRAKRRGWFCVKLMRCNINAMPDRLLHRRGVTIYMEIKAPGEEPTPQQKLRHAELRRHGIPVHVIDDAEVAYEILQ